MATSLVDVLTRRTRAHLLDREATRHAASDIADLLAPIAGWDENERARQLDGYVALAIRRRPAGYADGSTSSSRIRET